jgi:hypothetical protein
MNENLILYAVDVTKEGVDLTVFENGSACTVELTNEMAMQLAELLVVKPNDGNDRDR